MIYLYSIIEGLFFTDFFSHSHTILYDPSPESKYTYSPKSYNKSSTNYKDKLLELYRPSIEFACRIKEKTLDD